MNIKNTTSAITGFFTTRPKFRYYLPQALTILGIIFIFGYFSYNAQVNMDNRGIDFGLRFLGEEASFDIQFSLIEYSGASTYARAYLVGLLNTILVAVIGIFFATILGVVIGISRLSPNYLISKVAEWYIEIFRNIPLLLQLFFWYFAALRALPLPKEAINFFDVAYLSVKGLYVPKFIWTNFSIFFYSLVASIVAIIFVFKYARKQQESTGKQIPKFIISSGIFIIIPLLTFLVGGVSLSFEAPVLTQLSKTIFNYIGGVAIIPELMALAAALSLYTATFIAECVRAGIMGVTKGQKEAAASIGLTPGQILRLVVMPQALRIIIPPTTNQYLNLTKNSSLAAAIAYPDIVLVFAGTAMMQTGRAIEIVSITMLTYLSLSIAISIFMNWYNKKMAIKEKMIKSLNFLGKPSRDKLNLFVSIGAFLFVLGIIDVILNSFFEINITSVLPRWLNYFTPLIFSFIGLYYIRIEFSGNRTLDNLNKNINSNSLNALLSLLIIFVLIQNIPPLLNWVFFDADFVGTSKEECSREGACWVFVNVWIKRLMYGLYPNAEIWRINLSFLMLIALVISGFFVPPKIKKYIIIFLLFVFPFIAINLISGGNFGLEWVETTAWGGLSLTFIISIFALLFCFPVGMFLALGRRSSAPVIRYSSIGFIEFWRGVPLITVLFMASVMMPMFLPDGTYMDKLVRVIIAITLFEAAYMAEVIRGGLQALPRGQYDAGKSLGMGYWRMHMLVILPQALKLVIPGIANTFLALVKDTPLILVVGLLELVGMIDMAKTNPDWLGFATEGYVFAGVVFWIICYSMSRYSQSLEKKYKTDR